MKLKGYQAFGVDFMVGLMHNDQYRGGILADEMGLGKTSMHFLL